VATQLEWYLQVNLKSRQLRLLVAIDDLGNLSRVAEATHVSLPAVSRALTELEKGLGLELFTRTARGLRPTAQGECIIRYARGMVTGLQQVRDELKALNSRSGGRVNVGVYPGSSFLLIPDALALLKQRSRNTNVQVVEGSSTLLLPQLWEGKLDLVVGRIPPSSPSSGLEERVLLEEHLTFVTRPEHPLAQRGSLEWSDLKDYPWVLPPSASQLREPLDRMLAHQGIEHENDYIEIMSLHLTRAYLYKSDAIAVMPHAAAHDPFQPIAVLPLSMPTLLRPAGVQWNRNRPLSPSARLMMDCLEEAAAKMKAQGERIAE
jgi:DNA-binding transcriptional LysR family regulator